MGLAQLAKDDGAKKKKHFFPKHLYKEELLHKCLHENNYFLNFQITLMHLDTI